MKKYILAEEFLTEANKNIVDFVAKFKDEDHEKLNKLDKYKERFVNNGISTDITWHTANTSVDNFNRIVHDVENNLIIKDKRTGELVLNRELIFKNEEFEIWQILDWQTAVNMGENTTWCISGRYNTSNGAKHSQAKEYFEKYLKDGSYTSFNIVINTKTNEKWCICTLAKQSLYTGATLTIWNSKDAVVSYIPGLPSIPELNYQAVEIINNCVIKKDGSKVLLIEAADPEADIEELVIPNGVTELESNAFKSNTHIKSIKCPDTLKYIGAGVFEGATSLRTIELNGGITFIGKSAFAKTAIEDITLPNSLRGIGELAFAKTGIKYLRLPLDLNTLGDNILGADDNSGVIQVDYKNISIFYDLIKRRRAKIKFIDIKAAEQNNSRCRTLLEVIKVAASNCCCSRITISDTIFAEFKNYLKNNITKWDMKWLSLIQIVNSSTGNILNGSLDLVKEDIDWYNLNW